MQCPKEGIQTVITAQDFKPSLTSTILKGVLTQAPHVAEIKQRIFFKIPPRDFTKTLYPYHRKTRFQF